MSVAQPGECRYLRTSLAGAMQLQLPLSGWSWSHPGFLALGGTLQPWAFIFSGAVPSASRRAGGREVERLWAW